MTNNRWALRSLVIAAGVFVSTPSFAADYTVDPDHTSVSFTVRHLMSKVRGNFNTVRGNFSYDPKQLAKSTGVIEIDTASLDTNHPKRDGHLRSADFFDVDNAERPDYKTMKFVIKSAEQKGSKLLVYGDLTIRGVTKPVVLEAAYLGEATDPWGNKRAGFSAVTKINRKDYGLAWNKPLEAGGVLVGDEVEIELEVEALPKK